MNAPISEAEGTSVDRQEYLVCDKPLPDETVGTMIDTTRRSKWLADALDVLSERELRIVRDRRLSEEGETLESLGVKLGISKERVRQIETKALAKLRAVLVTAHPEALAV